MKHAAGLAVLALALLPSPAAGDAPASARPPRVALSFHRRTGAEACPPEQALRSEVTGILGHAAFSRTARRTMSCVLWADSGVIHARIVLRDAKSHHTLGVRELSAKGPDCRELGSAVALAIALAIDPLARAPVDAPAPQGKRAPSAASGPPVGASMKASAGASVHGPDAGAAVAPSSAAAPPAAGSPDAGAEPLVSEAVSTQVPDAGEPFPVAGPEEVVLAADPGVTSSPPEEPPLPAEVVATTGDVSMTEVQAGRRPWHFIAGLGVDWTVGLVPSAAFGAVAQGGIGWTFASAELEVRWLPSTSITFEGGTISSSLVSADLVGCATFGSWGACGLVQVGALDVDGKGFAQSRSSTAWLVALGIRGQWDWVFAHPVGLRVHVDGLVNVVRPRLLVDSAVAWTGPPVALVVGMGLFILF